MLLTALFNFSEVDLSFLNWKWVPKITYFLITRSLKSWEKYNSLKRPSEQPQWCHSDRKHVLLLQTVINISCMSFSGPERIRDFSTCFTALPVTLARGLWAYLIPTAANVRQDCHPPVPATQTGYRWTPAAASVGEGLADEPPIRIMNIYEAWQRMCYLLRKNR